MTVTHFVNRHTESLNHLLVGCCTAFEPRYTTPEQSALDHFTIAVSREVGTPALEVAQQVGERLGWPVYEGEVAARIADILHLPIRVVEAIDERRPSWLVECFETFNSHCDLSEGRYFHQLISVIRSLGEQGRCLIVGHGAEHLLPQHATLRVHLVGHREDRLAAFARAGNLDHRAASRQLDQIDSERSRFLREHFYIDPGQPRNYDLVVNTSQWTASACAEFILRALHHKANERFRD